jgi:hypothetical protein
MAIPNLGDDVVWVSSSAKADDPVLGDVSIRS